MVRTSQKKHQDHKLRLMSVEENFLEWRLKSDQCRYKRVFIREASVLLFRIQGFLIAYVSLLVSGRTFANMQRVYGGGEIWIDICWVGEMFLFQSEARTLMRYLLEFFICYCPVLRAMFYVSKGHNIKVL